MTEIYIVTVSRGNAVVGNPYAAGGEAVFFLAEERLASELMPDPELTDADGKDLSWQQAANKSRNGETRVTFHHLLTEGFWITNTGPRDTTYEPVQGARPYGTGVRGIGKLIEFDLPQEERYTLSEADWPRSFRMIEPIDGDEQDG